MTIMFDHIRLNADAAAKLRPDLLIFVRNHLPRLVLEVFGATGAIWGFSEALGLRSSSTNWFWRPASLIVGALFFTRWTHQVLHSSRVQSPSKHQTEDQTSPSSIQLTSSREDDEMNALLHNCRSPTPNKSFSTCLTANTSPRTSTKLDF